MSSNKFKSVLASDTFRSIASAVICALVGILVMYEGEIVGELNPKETSPEELGLYMAGAKRNVEGAKNE